MKEYKLVCLNMGLRSFEKDLEVTQKAINEQVAEGWILQQIINNIIGLYIGVFYKEK